MFIFCSWCAKAMGEKEPLNDRTITHGVCSLCQEEIARQMKEWEQKQQGGKNDIQRSS